MEEQRNLKKEMNLNKNNNEPIIFTPGLNQLYYVNVNLLNYSSLSKEIFEIINNKKSSINSEEIIFKLVEDFKNNKIKNYKEYKDILFTKIGVNFTSLLEYFDEWNSKNINYMHKNQINFLKSIKINIYNENPFYLLIDEICLKKYQKENIIFNYYTIKEIISTELINNIIINNKIFLYSYEPSNLILFKQNFKKNIFTFLLNTYLFCYKDLIKDSEEYKIVNHIKNYFEKEKLRNNIYNDSLYVINNDINFLSLNIFSYNFLYYEIISRNIESYESLINYFEEIHPKIVLIFTRFLTRKQNFVKQRYFISYDKLIYKPHYGGLDKACNGKIDLVLPKLYELKDLEDYKPIFNFIEENYISVNDINEFRYFIDKNLQHKYLSNFCTLVNNNSLINTSHQKNKLNTMKSITMDINKFKNAKELINTLQKNNIEFPIILKYTSNNPEFKHQISIILNENYLNNFINNYLNKILDEEYSTTVLIQHIVNHGGYVLKIYHMGNKNYIDYRSSLIDINEENKELVNDLFKNGGYWNFKTIMLESDEYKNNIWSKYTTKDGVEKNIINNKDLMDYIINITNLFEIYSHMGLFGIDIIIEKNKLYIIDANSLPGYKKGFDVEKDLRNYFKNIIS